MARKIFLKQLYWMDFLTTFHNTFCLLNNNISKDIEDVSMRLCYLEANDQPKCISTETRRDQVE